MRTEQEIRDTIKQCQSKYMRLTYDQNFNGLSRSDAEHLLRKKDFNNGYWNALEWVLGENTDDN